MSNSLPPGALSAPSTLRNRDPILAVLKRVLPPDGTVLEVASGTGEHAIYFAAALPHLSWQPTEVDEVALRSIAAHRKASSLPNVRAPLVLDAATSPWPIADVQAVVGINMLHISPWRAAVGLFTGASQVIRPGGVLYLYGPYCENGVHTASSNAVFDESLRARNPEWGVRDVHDVEKLGQSRGFSLEERVAMPANNLSLVFRKKAAVSSRGTA